jgi:hypothetical protein
MFACCPDGHIMRTLLLILFFGSLMVIWSCLAVFRWVVSLLSQASSALHLDSLSVRTETTQKQSQ